MNLSPLHYHKQESVKSVALGTPYRQDSTNRAWRYTENAGTTLAAGKLTVQADTVSNHINLSFAVAPAVGDREIKVTLGATAAAADLYADGFANIQDGTGEGVQHPLSGSHSTFDASATATFLLGHGERILVAGAISEANVDLEKNSYKDVVISAADQADVPVGVPNIAVTASYYFMVQTWGPCSVLQDETTAIGDMVTIGSSVTGAVEADDAAGEPLVGIQGPNTAVDTEYQTVYLRITP